MPCDATTFDPSATAETTSFDDVSDALDTPAPVPDGGTDLPADASPTRIADAPSAPATEPLDLDAIERDLTGVEVALNRLADGTYRIDEVTGEPIAEDALARNPLARRA